MEHRKILVTGVVQGVGFRPFIYQIATRANLTGWVANTSAGVEIEVEGIHCVLDTFLHALVNEKPPLASIDSIESRDLPSIDHPLYPTFEIRDSIPQPGAFIPISPDISICPDCLRELFDPRDRRYLYPFINCTNCGPRFTIIQDIPYDRPNTTMRDFAMCEDCAREYHDPLNRRFHAQPIACPQCGPQVWLEANHATRTTQYDAIEEARHLLTHGAIVAIKGLGGFHLACDAINACAVQTLRERKGRVDKPFALMMRDIATVEQHCHVSDAERALLESRERPIVLLRKKPGSPTPALACGASVVDAIAPRNNFLGVMLPYTPLHHLLFQSPISNFQSPILVMTSGNLSEEPIATENDEARERLANLADAFLMHNRDIRTRCDDSVVRVTLSSPSPVTDGGESRRVGVIRRSRGYAPLPVHLPFDALPLLATGAELKNTFCLMRDRYAFLSHHIGDLENYETLRSFEDGVAQFEKLFHIAPQAIAYDLHPNYLATRYALERAEREGLRAIGVQHHHAHIAACMVENGLSGDEPVIGVAFDGTGYGDDSAIWGGEFLITDYQNYQRVFHLQYIPLPGGDKAIREPWRIALAWLHKAGIEWTDDLPPVRAASQDARRVIQNQIERGVNAPVTSSMGRLFDAVAALAGVRQMVNYEAQAAIEFENQYSREASSSQYSEKNYEFLISNSVIDPTLLIHGVVADVRAGVATPIISARFHNSITAMVHHICSMTRERWGVNQVALSGGVWQNMTLLSRTLELLQRDGFVVYTHHQVPTNDGGIALGQAIIASSQIENRKSKIGD